MRTPISVIAAAAACTILSCSPLQAAGVNPDTSGLFSYDTAFWRGVPDTGTLAYVAPTGNRGYLSQMRVVFYAQESILRAAFANPNRDDITLRIAVVLANRSLMLADQGIRAADAAAVQAKVAASAAVARQAALAEQAKADKAALASRLFRAVDVAPVETDAMDLRKAQSDELSTIAHFRDFKPLAAQFGTSTVSALYQGKSNAKSAFGYLAEGNANILLNITDRRFAGTLSEFDGIGCVSRNSQKCADFASKLNFTAIQVSGMVTPNGFVYKGGLSGNGASGNIDGLFRAAGGSGGWSANVNNKLGTTGATIADSQDVTGTWEGNLVTRIPASPAPPTGAFSSWAGTALSGVAVQAQALTPKGYVASDIKQALYSGATSATVVNLHNNESSVVAGDLRLAVNLTQRTVSGVIGNFVGSKSADTANFLNAGSVNVTATVDPATMKKMNGTATWTPVTAKAGTASGSFAGALNTATSTAQGNWGLASSDFKLNGAWGASAPAVLPPRK